MQNADHPPHNDEPEKLKPEKPLVHQNSQRSYSASREYIKDLLSGWLDWKTFFVQRAEIVRNPTLMITYPKVTNTSFKSPLKFSIQCVSCYVAILYIVITPMQFLYSPVDSANAEYAKWFIATIAKTQGLMIPITILVSSYIFEVIMFRKPATLAIHHARVVHMTYIQAILFWPGTIFALMLNAILFRAYYFTVINSQEHLDLMKAIDESEKLMGALLMFLLLCYLKRLSMIFGTTKTHVFLSMWLSNVAGGVTTVFGYIILFFIFTLLRY